MAASQSAGMPRKNPGPVCSKGCSRREDLAPEAKEVLVNRVHARQRLAHSLSARRFNHQSLWRRVMLSLLPNTRQSARPLGCDDQSRNCQVDSSARAGEERRISSGLSLQAAPSTSPCGIVSLATIFARRLSAALQTIALYLAKYPPHPVLKPLTRGQFVGGVARRVRSQHVCILVTRTSRGDRL